VRVANRSRKRTTFQRSCWRRWRASNLTHQEYHRCSRWVGLHASGRTASRCDQAFVMGRASALFRAGPAAFTPGRQGLARESLQRVFGRCRWNRRGRTLMGNPFGCPIAASDGPSRPRSSAWAAFGVELTLTITNACRPARMRSQARRSPAACGTR
jgi:hypothetical protein